MFGDNCFFLEYAGIFGDNYPGNNPNNVRIADLQGTNKKHWLEGVVHSKVKTTVDNDSHTRDIESTVEAADTITGKGLFVNINESIELPLTTLLCSFGIIGQTCTSVVQRINKEERASTSSSSRSQVASKPLPVSILVLLKVEHALEVVLEGKVQCLKQDGALRLANANI